MTVQRLRGRFLVRAVLTETAGVATALTFALIALAHVAASDRAWMLFYDGDSVLLPLLHSSLSQGGPLEWAMSTTLFIPETLQYLLSAATASTPQQAIAINGALNVLAFYLIARVASGMSWPRARRTFRVLGAAVAIGVFSCLVLLESTRLNNSFELYSLNLTGTYYSSTLVATGAAALLAAAVLHRATRSRPFLPLTGALAVVTAVSATTCQMFVVWSVAPLVVLLLLGILARRIPRVPAIALGAALVLGVGLSFLLRIPFQAYVSAEATGYLRLFDSGFSLAAFRHSVILTAESGAAGVAVLLALLGVAALSVSAAVRSVRRGERDEHLLLAVLPALTGVALVFGAVLTGQTAPRYLLPGAVLPVLLAPALARALLAGTRIRDALPRVPSRVLSGALVAGAVLLPVATAVAGSSVEASRLERTSCIDGWAAEHPGRVGIGQFWLVRGLQVYSSEEVTLLQARPWLEAYAWMVDLNSYRVPTVSYLLYEPQEWDEDLLQDALGLPAETTPCGDYEIWDYAGTAGESVLTERIVDTAAAERARRGW